MVLVPIAAFVVSLALAPLSIVMAAVSTVQAVRHARTSTTDLAWWRAGVVLGPLVVIWSAVGFALSLASR